MPRAILPFAPQATSSPYVTPFSGSDALVSDPVTLGYLSPVVFST